MDDHNSDGGRVQEELERQLREFGETVGDAFAHGFDGKGQDIGDAAYDVGRAAARAANRGFSRAAAAVRGGVSEAAHVGSRRSAIDDMRRSAKKRRAAGIAMLMAGGFMAFSFGTGGLAVLGAASAFTPTGAVADITLGGSFAFSVWSDFWLDFGSAALTAMGVTGWLLMAVTTAFIWMMFCGWQRVKAARWLDRCADTVSGIDAENGISLEFLKDDISQKTRKIVKRVRKYISKGWLTAWLDEPAGRLYLTADDWRAAQRAKREAPSEPKPESEEKKEAPANLETARRFVKVIEAEHAIMRDEQAREELAHMQKTAEAICDWLEAHPESLPKTRRFAEYYIPTTLKLLHTYNDVQGQSGENAEAIRRDIAGILHTLNQAYDNLYDTLLSDMALDVSGEIAALQGMLANDGLTGEEIR